MMVREEGRFSGVSPFPIVSARIHHDALHGRGGVVALHSGGVAAVVFRNHDTSAVRVEKQLGGVKAETARGIGRSVNAEAVDLSGLNAGYEGVPIVISAVGCGIDADNARRTRIIFAVEKQQLDAGRKFSRRC